MVILCWNFDVILVRVFRGCIRLNMVENIIVNVFGVNLVWIELILVKKSIVNRVSEVIIWIIGFVIDCVDISFMVCWCMLLLILLKCLCLIFWLL